MKKSSVIGFLLIALIIVVSMLIRKPSKQKTQAQSQKAVVETTTPKAISSDTTHNEDEAKPKTETFGAFALASVGEEQFWTIENDLQRLTFSSKGGFIKQVQLTQYKTYDQQDLISFDPETALFDIYFYSNNKEIHTSKLFFKPFLNGEPYEGGDLTVTGEDSLVFALRAYADNDGGEFNENQYLEYSYVIPGNNYMLGYNLKTVGLDQIIDKSYRDINLDWKVDLLQHEKDVDRFINTTIYYQGNNKDVKRINDRKNKKEDSDALINWLSFKERFFCNVLVSKEGFLGAKFYVNTETGKRNPKYFKTMAASVCLPYDCDTEVNEFPMAFYFGPNHFKTLKSYGIKLQRQIDVGNFFLIRWINYGVIYVFDWLGSYGLPYGLVILILTILIKLLLFPIAFKSYKSSAVTRLLKPEMEAINAKYPKEEDAMKKQQAVLELQRQAGVSPASGCIPMLLQFPILIAVFRFFPSSIELRQQSFLWAEDLSTYDSVLDLPFTIPFYGDHVSLFCLLMTITTFIYTYVNNKQMDASANPQMKGMKIMMYVMPIMFLGIFNSYSAGLSYYYMLANIITFIQMFVFRRMISEEKVRATIEENKKKPQKKSRFMQRLEAAQKAQQQQMKNNKR